MILTAEKLFYSLAGFLLLTALFVLHPADQPEVSNLQKQMIGQFTSAWHQTMGDQPYFGELALVFESVSQFYTEAGNASVALLEHGVADRDLAFIFNTAYQEFGTALARISQPDAETAALAAIGPDFMSEQPIYNIIPSVAPTAVVSGVSVEPVNLLNSWVTIRDNFTGQIYCLAVYNGNVNKYLGVCKNNEYH